VELVDVLSLGEVVHRRAPIVRACGLTNVTMERIDAALAEVPQQACGEKFPDEWMELVSEPRRLAASREQADSLRVTQ
jgi:hypothetical protein